MIMIKIKIRLNQYEASNTYNTLRYTSYDPVLPHTPYPVYGLPINRINCEWLHPHSISLSHCILLLFLHPKRVLFPLSHPHSDFLIVYLLGVLQCIQPSPPIIDLYISAYMVPLAFPLITLSLRILLSSSSLLFCYYSISMYWANSVILTLILLFLLLTCVIHMMYFYELGHELVLLAIILMELCLSVLVLYVELVYLKAVLP